MMARAVFYNSLFSTAKWGISAAITLYFAEKIIIDLIVTYPERLSPMA